VLEDDVRAGTFRADLFYRLSVFTVTLPPLRERREDIPLLVDHFVAQLRLATGKTIRGVTPTALAALTAYDYPGNVRELKAELERAFALADEDGYVTADELSAKLAAGELAPPTNGSALRASIERFEMQLIQDALARHGGNRTRTASDLGVSRRTLIDKLQRYHIR
jgi:transcriptional regulator with PAS, ATPase and Fis domain